MTSPPTYTCRARQTSPRLDRLGDREPVAIDIEFEEWRRKNQTGSRSWKHRIGRVAVVNTRGQLIYDTFAHYPVDPQISTKLPPPEFGVFEQDLKLENGARHIDVVEEDLRRIFDGRLVVGHGLRLDTIAVPARSWYYAKGIWDSQITYGEVRNLKDLLAKHVKTTEHFNWHDPKDDAYAAMLLYLHIHPRDLAR